MSIERPKELRSTRRNRVPTSKPRVGALTPTTHPAWIFPSAVPSPNSITARPTTPTKQVKNLPKNNTRMTYLTLTPSAPNFSLKKNARSQPTSPETGVRSESPQEILSTGLTSSKSSCSNVLGKLLCLKSKFRDADFTKLAHSCNIFLKQDVNARNDQGLPVLGYACY
jgi:hypothetical protein